MAEVRRILISPTSVELDNGQATALTVLAFDGFGDRVPLDDKNFTVQWAVSDTAVLRVDGRGGAATVTAVASGEAHVDATVSALRGTAARMAARAHLVARRRAVRLIISSGNNQSGNVRSVLADPIKVQVLDDAFRPVPGADIRWLVVSGSGSVVGASMTSDSSGFASADWILGSRLGEQTLRVASGELSVMVNAHAHPSAPDQVVLLEGDGQHGPAGARLDDSLAVQVRDEYGNAISGIIVNWSLVSGGGSLRPTSSTTDQFGVARSSWTLGPVAGPTRARAWVPNVGEVDFTATIQSGGTQPTVSRVVLLPDTVRINALGSSATLSATAYDGSGQVVAGSAIAWRSLNPTIASIDNGRVTAVAAGTARIVATATCCNKADTAWIFVQQQAAALTVSPSVDTIQAGGSSLLTATVLDASGSVLPAAVVTWSTSNVEIAGVTQGMVSGRNEGRTTIRAVSGSLVDSAVIVVRANTQAPTVDRLVLTPDTTRLNALSAQATLVARTYDPSGQVVSGTSITWQSLNSMIASVDNTGRVTARAVGTARIVATALCCNRADTAVVQVQQLAASLTVSPRTDSIPVGATSPLTATVRDANGNVIPSAAVNWVSVHPGIATVAQGLVSGVAVGTATIRAVSGSESDSARITIVSASQTPAVTQLVLSPDTVTLNALSAQTTLVATTYDASGQVVPGSAISWSSLNPMIATVSNTGRVTARAVGKALIVATALCCTESDTTEVNVQQQLASLSVSPKSATLQVGGSLPLVATARDASNNVIQAPQISWTSTNPSVATVSQGVVNALSAGTTTIRVTSGSFSDEATITVSTVAPPTVATVTVSPTSATVALGAPYQFSAVARDANGNPISGQAINWSSSNLGIATVSGSGAITTLALGSVTITASVGGKSGQAQLSITPVAPPSQGTASFRDNFESGNYTGVQGGTWVGGGSGNVFVGTGGNGSSYALNLIHRGKPSGGQSTAEQRFRLTGPVSEFWMEYDFYLPSNFYHRLNPTNTDNNKFLAIWEETYSSPTPSAEVYMNFWPVDAAHPGKTGDSYMTVKGNLRGSPVNRPFTHIDNMFTNAERGRWNQFRLHMKLASGPSTDDGVVEIWWNGVLRAVERRLALPSAPSYFKNGYLLGWATSGYDQDTHFKIDNIRIYTTNPGW
jgi:uncharacterized protein YjdB